VTRETKETAETSEARPVQLVEAENDSRYALALTLELKLLIWNFERTAAS